MEDDDVRFLEFFSKVSTSSRMQHLVFPNGNPPHTDQAMLLNFADRNSANVTMLVFWWK